MSSKHVNVQTLGLYWNQIRKYKISFFTMLVAIPTAALLFDTVLPYALSQAIGTLAEKDTDLLFFYLSIAAGAALLATGINFLGFQTAIRHEARVRKDLVHDTISRLLAKDRDFFSNQKIGALTGRFIDFITAHIGIQDLFILRTLTFVVTITSGIVIISMHSWVLGLAVIGLMLWFIIQIKITVSVRRKYRHARKEQIAEVNGAVADSISNNLTVKTFAHEEREVATIDILTEKLRKTWIQDLARLSFEGSVRLFIMATFQIGAIALLATMMINGYIELGIAIFIIAYLQRIASQLFLLGEMINGYDKLFLQASPITEILMSDHLVKDAPDAQPLNVKSGRIRFENVSFSYADSLENGVIRSLNLNIEPGQKVGLVGRSGAGKTTITTLLLRFADINSGQILIDEQNIAHVTQESLRKSISYVPQEPVLFHRSLKENIAYGKPDATDEEIIEASRQARAIEFIEKLPKGLDTIVGERGVKLSGGQRQRIAIARTILKNAPILILDEATSALDSESEILIQEAFAKLMKDRTSIVVAHRLSTIAKLDRIVVLDQGAIVEDGTHAELIKRDGVYAKLWKHQSGGFIEE